MISSILVNGLPSRVLSQTNEIFCRTPLKQVYVVFRTGNQTQVPEEKVLVPSRAFQIYLASG